jgi:hypothetical protein
MSFTPESVFAMLTTRAEEATLRRLGTPPIDVAVLAKIDDAAPATDLASNMAQFQRRVVISDLEISEAGWPGPPKRNDQIISHGQTLTIITNDPVIIGDLVVMHRIMTRGG